MGGDSAAGGGGSGRGASLSLPAAVTASTRRYERVLPREEGDRPPAGRTVRRSRALGGAPGGGGGGSEGGRIAGVEVAGDEGGTEGRAGKQPHQQQGAGEGPAAVTEVAARAAAAAGAAADTPQNKRIGGRDDSLAVTVPPPTDQALGISPCARPPPPPPPPPPIGFDQLCPGFMLPFMQLYDRPSHAVDWVHRDWLVLARCLLLLGNCLRLVAPAPMTVQLGGSLLEFLASRCVSCRAVPSGTRA